VISPVFVDQMFDVTSDVTEVVSGLPPALHPQRAAAPPPLRPSSSTTTLDAAAAHSAGNPSQPTATNLMTEYN
jgi:hypothetical protein